MQTPSNAANADTPLATLMPFNGHIEGLKTALPFPIERWPDQTSDVRLTFYK